MGHSVSTVSYDPNNANIYVSLMRLFTHTQCYSTMKLFARLGPEFLILPSDLYRQITTSLQICDKVNEVMLQSDSSVYLYVSLRKSYSRGIDLQSITSYSTTGTFTICILPSLSLRAGKILKLTSWNVSNYYTVMNLVDLIS